MVTPKIPEWAAHFLPEGSLARIEDAVRTAESHTSGEIVPMVVAGSSVVGHVLPLLVSLLVCVGVAGLAGAQVLLGHGLDPLVSAVSLIVLVGMSWPLSRLATIRRWLSPEHDMDLQVHRRAALEFHAAGLDQTSGGTGVLLFVSVGERRAVVLADKTIAEHLPAEAWEGVVGEMVAGLRGGDLGKGFVDAILHCGKIVAPHFPPKAGKSNELGDALIIKD